MNNCGEKIAQFKRSSEKTCPTENDYCSLFYVQFHYNSTFMDENFCGYSTHATCDFGASRASTAYFIRHLYAKQNRPKNDVQDCKSLIKDVRLIEKSQTLSFNILTQSSCQFKNESLFAENFH